MAKSDQHRLFEQWTRDHGAIIYRVVNGFAEREDRHDLLQEIFLAVWKSIPAFRHQAKASTFLYRVCHNAALVWRRRRSNYRRRIERLGEVGLEPSPALAPDESGREELLAGLYAAIRELAPPDRSLILLSLDGVSYREMAEIHGLSESNVGVRLNRIKQRLAQTLKGQNDDPR